MGGVHTDDHRAPATERWRRRTHTPGRMRTSLILEFGYFLKVDVYSRERAPTAPAPFAGAASGLAGLVLGLLLGALRTTEGRVVLPFAYKSSKSTPSSPVPAVSSSSRR